MADSEKVDLKEELLDAEARNVADIVLSLKEDMKTVKKLKSENKALKEQISGLLQNNSKFTALVESLDERLREANELVPQNFEYHFEGGGWQPKGALKKHQISIRKKKLDIKNINAQLEEIIRLLKRNKK